MKKIFILLMMALATCNISAKSNFVQVKDGHFVRDGKPYYYVGTNFWYGAILGSEGQGGNRERLCKELDKMKEMGKRKMVAVLYLNNSWEWSGFANPKHEQWQVGDDYTGDPAQEAQGLNSVFSTDKSTLDVVKTQVDRMKKIGK